MVTTLDEIKEAAAPALSWLQATLDKINADTETREHRVLRLAHAIEVQQKTPNNGPALDREERKAIYRSLSANGMEFRARTSARYVGSTDVAENTAKIEKSIERLARDDEGNLVPWEEFQKKLFHIYAPVLTGHPVFSRNPKVYRPFARYFTSLAAGKPDLQAQQELHEAMQDMSHNVTLRAEYEQMIDAMREINKAFKVVERAAIRVGRRTYPNDWKKISYMPLSAWTWIPGDGDGRTDVTPWDNMEMKNGNQIVKYDEDLIPDFQELAQRVEGAEWEALLAAIARMEFTSKRMKDHRQFFMEYNPVKDPSGEALAARSRVILDEIDPATPGQKRITHPRDLLAALPSPDIAREDPSLEEELILMRDRLKNHGITIVHSHFRVNSKTVMSMLSDHFGINAPITEDMADSFYRPKIQKWIGSIRKAWPSSFKSLRRATSTVAKQMLTMRRFQTLFDSHSPIRELKADTHIVSTNLALLAAAKQYGVDGIVDISPLFEDETGIKNFQKISAALLKNADFVDYLVNPRPDSLLPYRTWFLEEGYSDLSRGINQIAASSFHNLDKETAIEELAALMHRDERARILVICFFATHGASWGRGLHPWGAAAQTPYIASGHMLDLAKQLGIHVSLEESLQGVEGYGPYRTFESSLACLAQALEHLTADHRKSRNDPWFTEGIDTLTFNKTIWAKRREMQQNDNYKRLMAFLAKFLPKTGSRAVKRTQESGEQLDIRMIPQTGGAQQVELCDSVTYGVASAIQLHPEIFENLKNNSEEFKLRMGMLEGPFGLDPTVLLDYIEILNPAVWDREARACANAGNEEEAALCRAVAQQLRTPGTDYYGPFSAIATELITDFEYTKAEMGAKEDTSPEAKKARSDRDIAHAMRLSAMKRLFKNSMIIYDFPVERHQGLSREKIINGLFHFDAKSFDDLDEVFGKAANGNGDDQDYGEPDEVPNDSINYTRLHEDSIDPVRADIGEVRLASHVLIDYLCVG